MYWQEQQDQASSKASKRVVDVAYRMQCKAIPVDHAHSLSQAVRAALPWFDDEPDAGVHVIHGADSGNGWNRPEGDSLLLLTRRTRLQLRIPMHRLNEALGLKGQTLDVDGHAMAIGEGASRPLTPSATLYSRYLLSDPAHSEEQFMAAMAADLHRMGIIPKKMLPGRSNRIAHPDGELFARSLMVADLENDESTRLLEQGLGQGRKMGLGLFTPHKSIKNTEPDE